MKRWVAATCRAEWEYTDSTQVGPIRGAALPMGFNRQPHYTRGLRAGRRRRRHGQPVQRRGHRLRHGVRAAGRATSSSRPWPGTTDRQREQALEAYPRVMKDSLGGYYTLGRVFVKLIGHPEVMRIATRYGLPRPTLMRFVLKLLANLAEPRGGDAMDRIITGLTKMAPAA